MARIFSIQFTYNGLPQHAMISMRTTPFFAEYTVAMLHEAIAPQLPNNKIISIGNQLVFSDSADENAPQLMTVILEAVAAHLQVIKA
jgi:hypothetical protein